MQRCRLQLYCNAARTVHVRHIGRTILLTSGLPTLLLCTDTAADTLTLAVNAAQQLHLLRAPESIAKSERPVADYVTVSHR